jgi:hypothetical protein
MVDANGMDVDDEQDDEDEGDEPKLEPIAPKLPKVKKSKGVGAAPAAPSGKFVKEGNDADQIWNDLVQWLPTQNMSPYDVSIQIKRLSPPAPGGGGALPMGPAFGGEQVAGNENETPGGALIQFVTRYIHLQTTEAPAVYDIHFARKATGKDIVVGKLSLGSANDCRNLIFGSQQAFQGAGSVPRFQPPPAQVWPQQSPQMFPQPQQPAPQAPQPPQQYYHPPQPPGYGAPPPTQPGVPPEMMQMFGTMMNELLASAREGRQPQMPHPGVANPNGGLTDVDVDRIAAKVAFMMGAGQPRPTTPPAPAAPPPTVAAPPSTTSPVDDMTGFAKSLFNDMMRMSLEAVSSNMKKGIQQTLTGVGGVPQVEETDEPAEIVPPENPQDAVPWTVADVGSTWANGSPVKIAISKETGGIDYTGVLFGNPAIAEKAMDLINGLGQAAQEFMKARSGVAGPPNPAAQVVREIPAGAVDAGFNGVPMPPNGPPSGWQAP